MKGLAAAHSIVEPSRAAKRVAGVFVIAYALVSMVPLLWIVVTGFKTPPIRSAILRKSSSSRHSRLRQSVYDAHAADLRVHRDAAAAPAWYDRLVRSRNMVIAGPSKYLPRYINSIIIGFGSTFLAVVLGTMSAYGFSRFKVPLKDDLLFFILSTRMMPPIAVAIPIYLMYRELGLTDTKLGMILLYTAVNVSLRGLAAQGLHRRNSTRI